jgi:hypothetical protein
MRIGSPIALFAAAFILGAGAACAADSTTRSRAMPPAPETPGPGAGSSDAAPSGSSQDPSSSLSDKLSRSGGVLQPPATVDPAMKQPAPPTGPQSMPVIPPPGTPGNDQGVKPK